MTLNLINRDDSDCDCDSGVILEQIEYRSFDVNLWLMVTGLSFCNYILIEFAPLCLKIAVFVSPSDCHDTPVCGVTFVND